MILVPLFEWKWLYFEMASESLHDKVGHLYSYISWLGIIISIWREVEENDHWASLKHITYGTEWNWIKKEKLNV